MSVNRFRLAEKFSNNYFTSPLSGRLVGWEAHPTTAHYSYGFSLLF
ncbi:MAG: hypothetical protein IJV35_00845 [Neisseriaceae bacterium]|nr:hypothetical protein [Neisseriaceae bacterium]